MISLETIQVGYRTCQPQSTKILNSHSYM
jgi:hypothetical protein